MNRFFSPPLIGAEVVLAILGAVTLGWLWLRGGRPEPLPPTTLLITFLPMALPLAAALVSSASDRSQTAIAIWAATLLASLLPGWHLLGGGVSGQGRFLLAYGALWLVLLIGYLLWLAPWAVRVPPPPGALPVAEHRLMQRVRSLAQTGLELVIEPSMSEPGQITVTTHFRGGKRRLSVHLTFLPEAHCVLAREVALILGDKPMNASETQMRYGIQPPDGTHPDAFIVHDASLTLTPPSQAARQALQLQIVGDQVQISPTGAAAEPDHLPHLLTELVHQSGWTWQGVFFRWQKGGR